MNTKTPALITSLTIFIVIFNLIWFALFIASIILFCLAKNETDETKKKHLNTSAIVCIGFFGIILLVLLFR